MSKYLVREGLDAYTTEFWYDLMEGGYLNPEEILVSEEDVEEVKNAIKILKDFYDSCEEQIPDFLQ